MSEFYCISKNEEGIYIVESYNNYNIWDILYDPDYKKLIQVVDLIDIL